jgi:hypothetical protein
MQTTALTSAPAAYVNAIRRMSALVAVVLGATMFREPDLPRRLAAACLACAGAACLLFARQAAMTGEQRRSRGRGRRHLQSRPPPHGRRAGHSYTTTLRFTSPLSIRSNAWLSSPSGTRRVMSSSRR